MAEVHSPRQSPHGVMAVVRRFSVPSGQKVHATPRGSILLPLRPLIRLARALHRAPVQKRSLSSACRCHMPRDKGGIGRTGSKHKKKASKKNQPPVRAAHSVAFCVVGGA